MSQNNNSTKDLTETILLFIGDIIAIIKAGKLIREYYWELGYDLEFDVNRSEGFTKFEKIEAVAEELSDVYEQVVLEVILQIDEHRDNKSESGQPASSGTPGGFDILLTVFDLLNECLAAGIKIAEILEEEGIEKPGKNESAEPANTPEAGSGQDPKGEKPFSLKALTRDFGQILLLELLEYYAPYAYHSLVLLNIIELGFEGDFSEPVYDEKGRIVQFPHVRTKIAWDRFSKEFFKQLLPILKEEYLTYPTEEAAIAYLGDYSDIGDDPRLKAVSDKLFLRLKNLLLSSKAAVLYGLKPAEWLDFDDPYTRAISDRTLTFWYDFLKGKGEFGASLSLVKDENNNIALAVFPFGEFSHSFFVKNWKTDLEATGFVNPFIIGQEDAETEEQEGGFDKVHLSFKVAREFAEDKQYTYRIGSAKGTRLELGPLSLSGGIGLSPKVEDVGILADFGKSTFYLLPADGDGFLAKVLPEKGIALQFELGIGWSDATGFHIEGGLGLEVTFSKRRTIGKIFEQSAIHLGINALTTESRFYVALSGKVKLGPVTASLDAIGMQMQYQYPEEGKNNFDIGFKSPRGVGIEIDAKAVKGGGALFFDRDKGEYAGVAELTVKNTISVKAVGIITTKLPDGSSGYSFLLFISAEFPPLQLGFGFTLNGVGGLVGIHRTMNPPFLQKGVRDQTLDDILFPEDPVKNAPRIISSLGQAFPVQPGQYIFGLMGIIGWGPKGFLSLELGLMIEVPDPLRFAILGVLKLSIKRDQLSIAHLQVNFIGIIDFDNKFLSFDASLYNSTLLTFRLEGDIALRVNWGAESFFLLSVGGFHPAFNDLPPDFPEMKRMRLSLVDQKAIQLSLYFYLAVTSNTFQIGSGVLLNVQVWKFRIIGEFTFDALFHSLTNFMVNVSFTIVILWGSRTLAGIALKGQLTGTSPWNIQGEATFTFAIWSYTIPLNETFGESMEEAQSGIELLPELQKELEDVRNWQQMAPLKKGQLVTLRKVQLPAEESTAYFLVYPTGGVAVRQSLLPLNIRLDKFGSQKPADYQRYQLELQDTAGQTLSGRAEKDLFAPAQYLELNDEEKLSRKSYERFAAGVAMSGSEGITRGNSRQRSVAYEQRVYDSWEVMVAAEVQAFAEESSPFQANLAVAGSDLGRSHAYEEGGYRLQEEEFMLVYEKDPELPLSGIPPFASETEALQYLEELEDRDPVKAEGVMVVSSFELV